MKDKIKSVLQPNTNCPSPLLQKGWLEIRGCGNRKTLYVSFAERVLSYSDTEISLKYGKEKIHLLGTGLTLSAFRSGSIEIAGNLSSIIFEMLCR